MYLNNLRLVNNGQKTSIHVLDGIINAIGREEVQKKNELSLSFENAIVFPGLINSHDHLDFNLFPQLGNKTYSNYTEWGKHIHQKYKNEINQVLQVPKELRIQWGIYKNLLNGVTTVVNHGERLAIENPPIDIFQQCYSLHSEQFEKNWRYKLNNPFKKSHPFVIHVGEGTDEMANNEITAVIKWNLLKREVIGIHGVAMTMAQATAFKALVWCPASNYFLFGKTAAIDQLAPHTNIIFGTDSTLTSDWNLWQHIRLAQKEALLTDEALYNSLTEIPAEVWGLTTKGKIVPGHRADLVIAKSKEQNSPINSFFATNPEDILMVLHKGEIVLFDSSLYEKLCNTISIRDYSSIGIYGCEKYVLGDIITLIENIKKYNIDLTIPLTRK